MAGHGVSGRSRIPPPSRPSLSRRSSVAYGKGQDPRPINDKAFQTAGMRKLVEYLGKHGYTFPFSPKLLPSRKDIENMIQFLFRQVDPHYRLIKLEDDVPSFFKTIGHPFQISKSALYAAGSPHSWPNLLAALVWLVDNYNCLEKENAEQDVEIEFSVFDHVAKSYGFFMQGDDQACDICDEQLERHFYEVMEEAQRIAGEESQGIMELEAKLQALQSEPSPCVALEAKKLDLLSDVSKFNTLIQSQTAHKTSLERKVEQLKQQLNAKNSDLAAMDAENQALSERVSSQTVNIEEFNKMTRVLERVEEDLQSAMGTRKDNEKETWDLEVLASKNLKKLESAALESNHTMRRLKLPICDNPAGNPLEVHINPRGETAHSLIGIDIKQAIRPHVASFIEDVEKNVREKSKESTDLLKSISTKEDRLQEKQAINAYLESKMKELEAMKKHEKLESMQSHVSKIQAEIEEDEEKLRALEVENTDAWEREKEKLEHLRAGSTQEISQKCKELFEVIEGVTDLFEERQEKNQALRADLDKLMDMVSNNYIRKLRHEQSGG